MNFFIHAGLLSSSFSFRSDPLFFFCVVCSAVDLDSIVIDGVCLGGVICWVTMFAFLMTVSNNGIDFILISESVHSIRLWGYTFIFQLTLRLKLFKFTILWIPFVKLCTTLSPSSLLLRQGFSVTVFLQGLRTVSYNKVFLWCVLFSLDDVSVMDHLYFSSEGGVARGWFVLKYPSVQLLLPHCGIMYSSGWKTIFILGGISPFD